MRRVAFFQINDEGTIMFGSEIADIRINILSYVPGNYTMFSGELYDEVIQGSSKKSIRFSAVEKDVKTEIVIFKNESGYACKMEEWFDDTEIGLDRYNSEDGSSIIFRGSPAVDSVVYFEIYLEEE